MKVGWSLNSKQGRVPGIFCVKRIEAETKRAALAKLPDVTAPLNTEKHR